MWPKKYVVPGWSNKPTTIDSKQYYTVDQFGILLYYKLKIYMVFFSVLPLFHFDVTKNVMLL